MLRRYDAIGLSLLMVTFAGCAKKEAATDTATVAATDTAKPATLYERLGGQPAITAVIDSFVVIVGKDNRINKKFAKSDGGRVKRLLVEQVCAATGGPCTYTGRSMKDTHKNMGVTEGEFNALVEDLTTTLNAFNVQKKEQDELLGALATMKGDIVEVPGDKTGTALPKNFVPVRDSAKK